MRAKLKLGCIADDFTGATDLANNLVRAGMRVAQVIGVPCAPIDCEADAVVVALKSRTIPPAEAVSGSLTALRWLQMQGAEQIYFKYCSTFDSTPAGNIGPVTEALMNALGIDFTVATPAFPDNQRTVYKGHLFVGDVLLSESGMRNHPLTPMTDSNLVRVMQAQTSRRAGRIDHGTVSQGEQAIRTRMSELQAEGVGVAVVDAIANEDLRRLGPALAALPLVTGGSGLAVGLPSNFGIAPSVSASQLPEATGLQAVVFGSCAAASNSQVAAFIRSGRPALVIDPLGAVEGKDLVARVARWAAPLLRHGPVLIYSTAGPAAVQSVQSQVGAETAGTLVERALAEIAQSLVGLGVRQLIIAGGETSGACVQALGITQLQIGSQIDPGVPWCYAISDGVPLHIALKSGNFGSTDFFSKAFAELRRPAR